MYLVIQWSVALSFLALDTVRKDQPGTTMNKFKDEQEAWDFFHTECLDHPTMLVGNGRVLARKDNDPLKENP